MEHAANLNLTQRQTEMLQPLIPNSSTRAMVYTTPVTTLNQLTQHLNSLDKIIQKAAAQSQACHKLNSSNKFIQSFIAIGRLLAGEIDQYQRSNNETWQIKLESLLIKLTISTRAAFTGNPTTYLLELNNNQFELPAISVKLLASLLNEIKLLFGRFGPDFQLTVEQALCCCCAVSSSSQPLVRSAGNVLLILCTSITLVGMATTVPATVSNLTEFCASSITGSCLPLIFLAACIDLSTPNQPYNLNNWVFAKLFCLKGHQEVSFNQPPYLPMVDYFAAGLSKTSANLTEINRGAPQPTCSICLDEVQPRIFIHLSGKGQGLNHYCSSCLQEWDQQKPGINPFTNQPWDGVLIYFKPASSQGTDASYKILSQDDKIIDYN